MGELKLQSALSRDLNSTELDDRLDVGVIRDISLKQLGVLIECHQKIFSRVKDVMAHRDIRWI
jgi:hypothetical protein